VACNDGGRSRAGSTRRGGVAEVGDTSQKAPTWKSVWDVDGVMPENARKCPKQKKSSPLDTLGAGTVDTLDQSSVPQNSS
jgi:hypothetical protein